MVVRYGRLFTSHSGGGAVPQWEAASRMSACGTRGGAGDRPDVGEHAAGVPGWEGSYQRRGAVELDAALAGGLGPGELAGVPFEEGFGFPAGHPEPTRPPPAERRADREEVVPRRCELVMVPAPIGLGCRLDDTEPF